MLADRLGRPVDEFLTMPAPRVRQWIAYCTWKAKEDERNERKIRDKGAR